MFETGPSQQTILAQQRLGMLLKGKWTLEKLLGTGGMASVYLGVHRNGSKVAVKILHTSLLAHSDTFRRFLNEGYIANKVEHPGVVTVLDDDLAPDGSPFLVMELLDGTSLDSILEEKGPFAMKQAVDLTCRVLDVLAAAHDKGIVHRDLKPANVFLLTDGRIKVLDFGIARLRDATNKAPSMMTMGGAVLGTPAFMPPEQARGQWDDVDLRSDIWAMGATLFMLLANKSVRDEAESTNEALLYAMAKPIAPMAELLPQIPSPVGHCIDRALAFDKNARWPNARAMKAGLERALIDIGEAAWETIMDVPKKGLTAKVNATPFVHMHTPAGQNEPANPLAATNVMLDGTMLSPQAPPELPRASRPSYHSQPPATGPAAGLGSNPLFGPDASNPQGPRLASRPSHHPSAPPPELPLFTGVRSPSGPPPPMPGVEQHRASHPSHHPSHYPSHAPMVQSGMSTTSVGGRSKVPVVIGALAVTIVLTFSVAILLLFYAKEEPKKAIATSASIAPSVTVAPPVSTESPVTAALPPASVSAPAHSASSHHHPSKPKQKPTDPLDKGRF